MQAPESQLGGLELKVVLNILGELGLREREIRVLEVLFTFGPRPASFIARKAGFNRPYTYDVLGTLEKKGFLSSLERNSVKSYVAPSIDDLRVKLEEQRDKLTSIQSELAKATSVIPRAIFNGIPSRMGVFSGANAAEKALKRFSFGSAHPFLLISGQPDEEVNSSSDWTREFERRRKREGVPLSAITIADDDAPMTRRPASDEMREGIMVTAPSPGMTVLLQGDELCLVDGTGENALFFESTAVASMFRWVHSVVKSIATGEVVLNPACVPASSK
ncbi:MAG: hypothetical protein IT290_06625 [Deltaproteobacteria bacterium]|nr:hypothetical protein [Deltaproteobacteria bacterium]